MAFQILSELGTIPNWFNDFKPKKLIDHPVPSVKYIIWLIQLGALVSVGLILGLLVFGYMPFGWGAFSIFVSFFGILLSQTLILGIQARSRLAWLLLVCNAIRFTFSILFIVGLVLWYLIDQEETVNYFNGQQAPELVGNN